MCNAIVSCTARTCVIFDEEKNHCTLAVVKSESPLRIVQPNESYSVHPLTRKFKNLSERCTRTERYHNIYIYDYTNKHKIMCVHMEYSRYHIYEYIYPPPRQRSFLYIMLRV